MTATKNRFNLETFQKLRKEFIEKTAKGITEYLVFKEDKETQNTKDIIREHIEDQGRYYYDTYQPHDFCIKYTEEEQEMLIDIEIDQIDKLVEEIYDTMPKYVKEYVSEGLN